MTSGDMQVSVVINTDGRCASLKRTVSSLRQLKYPHFEVCIIYGPTDDGTREFVSGLGHEIKSAYCPNRNLSESRNLGIGLASGEIIAFIDDDGIPEPEWLDEVVAPFSSHEVAGSGGLVYDPTGWAFQYRYATCDRLGNATLDDDRHASSFNFPLSFRFPYVQGTNSAFRRSALVGIGGFDEEYEFYLDETDVCCRLVDEGLKVVQLANARVHHKFLPSHIRDENRITVRKYAVVKNKIYFSLINNKGHYSIQRALDDALRFVNHSRADLEWHIGHGRLTRDELETFEEEADRALHVGLERGLSSERRTRPADYFNHPTPFRPFGRIACDEGRRTIVLLSQGYPPQTGSGNARHTHDIAVGLAQLGHTVHVLTKGDDFNRVDLEEGVWVHRIVPKRQDPCRLASGELVPERIWDHTATMLEEVYRIDEHRPVDVVEGVGWDCETAAFILNGRFPVLTNIVTSLGHWLQTHDDLSKDDAYMTSFGSPMLRLEQMVFERSSGIIAASQAIVDSLAEDHRIRFDTARVHSCPHGLIDAPPLPRRRPKVIPEEQPGRVAIFFVGRLELRKGIDVLLAAIPDVLRRAPQAEFWIAGDDTLRLDGGLTAREAFETSSEGTSLSSRVTFLGPVSDDELRWLFGACDIFVSPSRFESFGLIFVEAMMFGKPVVGCTAGGVPEVVSDDTGILVAPGDPAELAQALSRLAGDPELRHVMGRRGRARYDALFDSQLVARRRLQIFDTLRREPIAPQDWDIEGPPSWVECQYNQTGRLLLPYTSCSFRPPRGRLYVTLLSHPWSGIVSITVDGRPYEEHDLFSVRNTFRTITVELERDGCVVTLARVGRKNEKAHDDEVVICVATAQKQAPEVQS